MSNAEFEMERKADDNWTIPKLVVLIVGTLGIGLGIIYALASNAAPY